jgi:hypothetical protein
MFGGDVPLAAVQSRLGRKLAIVRDYYRIGQSFPYLADRQAMAGGATLLVSLDSVPGMGPTYASIAAGQHDRAIRTFLNQVEHAAVTYRLGAIYIAFEHEADNPQHAVLGPPSEFILAWDHIHQLAQAAHLDWNDGGRLHWAWILTSFGFRSTTGRHGTPRAGAAQYWPGSGEVDIVAADGYNSANCYFTKPGTNMVATGHAVTTPTTLFGPVLKFAQTHGGLPVFVPEWGTVPYASPSVEPSYINQMSAYIQAHPQIAAVLYWDAHAVGNGCDYRLNNYPAAMAAFAAMGQAPGLQGRVPSA